MAFLETIADRIRQHPKLVIADDFEIALQHSSSTGMRYQNGELCSESQGERLWVSLRILHRKRGGKAVVLNPSIESLGALVEAAFESASRAAVDPWFRFPLWKAISPRASEVAAPFAYDSLFNECADRCAALEEIYDEQRTDTYLRRKTERFDLRHSRQSHLASLAVLAQPGPEVVLLKEERGQAGPLGERRAWVQSLAESAMQRASQAAKPCGRGKRRVVFSPRAAARLLRALSPWFGADAVQTGRSPLRECVGQAVFGDCLNLIDHGNHEAALWSAPFDLEGVATQRTVLVEKGRVKGWLFDVYSATRENRLSTGNFLRPAVEMHPRITPSALYFEPGTHSQAELFEAASNGVYFDNLEKLEPVAEDPARFILRGTGWRIAFGRCSEPLSQVEVQADLRTLFRSAAAVGKDLAFYAGYGSPSILVEDVPLGS